MTADTQIMRNAANEVSDEKQKYTASVEEIDNLIINTLANCWVDEAYDELKQKYTSKSQKDLQNLGELLQEFSKNLNQAAEDLDRAINSLR